MTRRLVLTVAFMLGFTVLVALIPAWLNRRAIVEQRTELERQSQAIELLQISVRQTLERHEREESVLMDDVNKKYETLRMDVDNMVKDHERQKRGGRVSQSTFCKAVC